MGPTADVSTQTPDFESEIATMTRKEVLDHFSSWPWQEHLDRQQAMEAAGEEACPPSMGVAFGDRNVFLMNVAPGTFDLLVSATTTTKRFGFLTRKKPLDWEISGVGTDVAAGFVEKIFVENDGEWIAFADSHAATSS